MKIPRKFKKRLNHNNKGFTKFLKHVEYKSKRQIYELWADYIINDFWNS